MDDIDERTSFGLSDVMFDEDGKSSEIKLLCGVRYQGVLYDTFTYREMTGEDEEAISKSELRSNQAKLITLLLERCIKSIGGLTRKELGLKPWHDLIASMYVGDQDFMLLAIRAGSLGHELEVTNECPNPDCKAKLKTFIDVDELSIKPFKGLEEIPFTLNKGYKDMRGNVWKDGIMRISTGLDREILATVFRRNPGLAKTMMLTRLVTFTGDNAPPTTELAMKQLTTSDRKILTDLIDENQFGYETTFEITCTTCGEVFTGDLSGTSFLS